MQECLPTSARHDIYGWIVPGYHQPGQRRPEPGQVQQEAGQEPQEADDSGGVKFRGASEILPGDEEIHQIVWLQLALLYKINFC